MKFVHYVYILIDPISKMPFYVGKGKGNRCFAHLNGSTRGENKRKDRRIDEIRKNGNEPRILKSFFMDEKLAYLIEEKLISDLGRIGFEPKGILTNFCLQNRPPNHKGAKRSKETIEKLKNRYVSIETRKRIGDTNRGEKHHFYGKIGPNAGKKFTSEHRENLRLAHLGQIVSSETIAKIKKASIGRKPSPQTIEASRKAKIGIKLPAEEIARRTATRRANDGYRRSPESIAKMLETNARKRLEK